MTEQDKDMTDTVKQEHTQEPWHVYNISTRRIKSGSVLIANFYGAGNLGWEIANCQAYGIHFPQKWNDDLRIMKAQIRMLENEH